MQRTDAAPSLRQQVPKSSRATIGVYTRIAAIKNCFFGHHIFWLALLTIFVLRVYAGVANVLGLTDGGDAKQAKSEQTKVHMSRKICFADSALASALYNSFLMMRRM
jgi:hypothetical protein